MAARKEFDALRHQASELIWKMLVASPGIATDIERAYLKAAHRLLVDDAVKSLPLFPSPDDFFALETDLHYIADTIDPLIHALGKELAANSNAVSQSDIKDCFSRPLLSALDGNALYQCQVAAQACAEDAAEDERSDREEHSTLHRAAQGV